MIPIRNKISYLVKSMATSKNFHGTIIIGPPGVAKSTAISEALDSIGKKFNAIGSYSTPLALYQALAKRPEDIHVLDDTHGSLTNPKVAAILKAALCGSGGSDGARRVTWNSSAANVDPPAFDFHGKLIISTNVLPKGFDSRAVMSRAHVCRIDLDLDQRIELIRNAKVDEPEADAVKDYIINNAKIYDRDALNYRTVLKGVELAQAFPMDWKELLESDIPKIVKDDALVIELANSDLPVGQQCIRFCQITGRSRATFYNYRKALNLRERALPSQEDDSETRTKKSSLNLSHRHKSKFRLTSRAPKKQKARSRKGRSR